MAAKQHWVVVLRRDEGGDRIFVKADGETSSLDEAQGYRYKLDATDEADKRQLPHSHVGRRSWFEAHP